MTFIKTPIPDLIVFEPKVWEDDRGYFYESYNLRAFADGGITTTFLQDNQAKSTYGVLRGLHYQVPPFTQAKLVSVLEGEVLDVVVDLREHSQTYGQWYSIRLSAENKKQLFVPRGFAHGYVVLSETAVFFYKVDNYYSKESEGGVMYNDPSLKIDWQVAEKDLILSEKDRILPQLGEHRKF